MLKELVILIGLLVCMFFFVPALSRFPVVNYEIATLPLFAFIGFLLYGAFHFKWLLDNHGRKYAVLFLLILLVTIIVGSPAVWLLFPIQQV